ncbi:MAG: hypothetical protein HOV81_44920 [Kofleriaceae bacterium]|nr:hypothetical protein [Kofleriaceae bacterium]
MRELVQRRGLIRRTYALTPDGIRVSAQGLLSGHTVSFPYLLMFGDPVEIWTSSRIAFVSTFILAALAIVVAVVPDAEPYAWAFWGAFAVVAGAYYYFSRSHLFGFTDGTKTLLFLHDTNPEQLKAFLAEARTVARTRARVVMIPLRTSGDPSADLHHAMTLHAKGIITDDELAEFKARLDGREWRKADEWNPN